MKCHIIATHNNELSVSTSEKGDDLCFLSILSHVRVGASAWRHLIEKKKSVAFYGSGASSES